MNDQIKYCIFCFRNNKEIQFTREHIIPQNVGGNLFIDEVCEKCNSSLGQYIDIQIFHFWKRLTKGKHLWLRNNFSTFLSQFIDTFTVLFLLCGFGRIDWDLFTPLLLSGFLFKVLVAISDTPFLYGAVYWLRKRFGLQMGEEIDNFF